MSMFRAQCCFKYLSNYGNPFSTKLLRFHSQFTSETKFKAKLINALKQRFNEERFKQYLISRRFFNNRSTNCTKSAFRSTRLVILSFTPFFWMKKKHDIHSHELSKEVLAHIPKEVFTKDKFKSKTKHGFVMTVLLGLWDNFTLCVRLVRVLCTFGPLLCLYPATYLSHSFTKRWWNLLLFCMEFSGPTFVKLGQWAGTRRDLFSHEFCDMCARLHDQTKHHAFYITKRKLRKSFGKRWRHIFEKIEKEPIGSGCIAQVHRAYMNANMIPDESIVEEVLSLEDTDGFEIDLAEGFEIMGFPKLNEYMERIEDRLSDTPKATNQNTSNQNTTSQNSAEPQKNGEDDSSHIEESVIETGSGALLDPETTLNPPRDSVEIVTQMDETPLSIQTDEDTLIPVAIKVLHPGVYRRVQRDLSILRMLTWMLQLVMPSTKWISLRESVEEFADLMTRQIDLRFEANCLETFNINFEENCHIRFPRPIRPYCKRDVLVETLEDGEPITNFLTSDLDNTSDDPEKVVSAEEMKSHHDVKVKIASIGVDALLQMIFCDNFVHGDLHPGNILVQNGRVPLNQEEKLILVDICDTVIVTTKPAESPIRLVLLDTGITTSLSDKDLNNFKDVFTAVVIGEGDKVGELMLQHARYSECKDIAGFKHELGELVMKFRQQTIQLGSVQVGDLLSQVFSTCSRHKVKMESNFASILIAIFVLEGLGRSLDPELDILERAKPILLS